ncbi:MAG: hypothetical protein WBB22_06630, partial [Anaerolineae bacterium]
MNRRSPSKILSVAGSLLLIAGITACDTPAPSIPEVVTRTPSIPEVVEPMPTTCEVEEGEGDLFNVIHQVEVDEEGSTSDYQCHEIPEDAFTTEERIEPEPPKEDDEGTPAEPARIHPLLLSMIEEAPEAVVPVIIILREDIQVPRFPDLPPDVRRDSAEGRRLSGMSEDLVNDLLAQRRGSTEEFLGTVEEQGIEIEVIEQFWL